MSRLHYIYILYTVVLSEADGSGLFVCLFEQEIVWMESLSFFEMW